MSDSTGHSATDLVAARAKAGDPQAQLEWARFLTEAAVPDFVESARWLRLASENGLAAGQYALGLRYLNGQGVGEDVVEAVTWLRRAAER